MSGDTFVLFNLTRKLPIMFKCDEMSVIFGIITVIIWALCGYYSIAYFKGDKKIKRYAFFYVLSLVVLLCLDMAANLITFYMFYELMTLMTVPLVFHNETKESLMAGLKYLFYSLFGAYCVLFGFYFVYRYSDTITFTKGGLLSRTVTPDNQWILLLSILMMLIGFSVKGGMFPMHAWLTTAHPVAPAPASAFLSGIIVKCGVLGIIRIIYYIAGPVMLRGTYVQTVMAVFSLITVFMGSMLAYREKLFKKRLAYSTVSQVSYIIFGLVTMNPIAFVGAILHVIYHAIIKSDLFLFAGIVIHETHKENVDELTGIGKQMPLALWSFTFASLALVGIPPAAGFISKWNLCIGALKADMGVLGYVGPAVLLISALLTAGYLLSIVIKGFLPGEEYYSNPLPKIKISGWMLIPVCILGIMCLVLGMFPNSLVEKLMIVASELM